ncbi:MAG: hypothetical protein QXP94_06365 [Thermofilaceae archaeon]
MRYGSVALAVTTASIGVVLLLVSIGYVHALTLASIPLIALGSWTLAYGVHDRSSYHGFWGGLLVGLGLALLLERVTGNLLLNFAALIIALSIGGLLLARKG